MTRLDAATATLVAAESRADRLVGSVSAQLRDVADAGEVDVPVMVPPAAMASASVAMTVSPAPVTSATSRAEAGR